MFRIGQGFDLHRVVPDRALFLGGISIPWEQGLLGHSDADVLLHAIIDAVLGSLALGDIGQWFPDTDPAYSGIASSDLLRKVMVHEALSGWEVANLDATVLAERPKLLPFMVPMRESIAGLLGIPADRVSVKATTAEGTDAVGHGQAIAAQAVVLLTKT